MSRIRVGVKLRDGPSLAWMPPIRNDFVLNALFARRSNRQYRAPIPDQPVSRITDGEVIGIDYPDAPIPVGPGRRDSRAVGVLETLIPRPFLPAVVGRQAQGRSDSASIPTAGGPPRSGTSPTTYEETWGRREDQIPVEYEEFDDTQIPTPDVGQTPVFIPVDASEEVPGDPVERREDEPMSSFWDYASGVIDVFQGQQVGGGTAPFAAPLPPAVTTPQSGMYINSRGQLCRRRRRRRRLLTESDFNDLMRIATLPNKQNVTVALAKAVGRR